MTEGRRKKSSRPSVITKTLDALADLGYELMAKVETWNHHVQRRQDLFGVADLIALHPEKGHLYVQVCLSDLQAHLKKYQEPKLTERLQAIVSTPMTTFQIYSWRRLLVKRGGVARRWVPKILTATMNEDGGIDWTESA